MSSILTNNGAMIALQTLRGINSKMDKTQSEISTGKSVATAKDNAAVWAISKTMESDVEGFKNISDSLSLGQSTVAVASQASETVTSLLTQMKGKIVSAQGQNVDRNKLQTDINALKDQITAVVGAAQFNGLNLLSNTGTTAGSGTVNVLSSLDRSSAGVAISNIAVKKQDLGTTASNIVFAGADAVASDRLSGTANGAATALTGNATPPTTAATIDSVVAGYGYSVAITSSAGAALTGAGFNTTASNANQISYVARDGDSINDVAKGLTSSFNDYVKAKGLDSTTSIKATVSGSTITFQGSSTSGENFTVQVQGYSGANTIGGGLAKLSSIDVSTSDATAKSSLTAIEGLIQTATDSAAAFGSVAGRLSTQSKFVSGLMDSLKSGIGTLVDADMEETSARLQALQTQQQLGVQSLSIANQAPQSILSLFRG